MPHLGLNASFAHADAQPGQIAFVSQSGALVPAVLDWANDRGIGFSHFASLGEHADVDFGDMLDYLGSGAHELIVGASIDPLFGPVILFGQGGTAVEVVADRALALPPLNVALAESLIERTRVARLLRDWRDRPGGAAHFAIRPYPQELIETLDWYGETLALHPIRPEDEAQHLAFLQKMDPEDIRLRIFYSRRSIEHSELARLTPIDDDREMAFIATRTGPDGQPETIGVVCGICDPDNETAEYDILVRSDLKGCGLGRLLTDKRIRYLRAHGTRRIVGTVLRENKGMLALLEKLGFAITPHPEDPDLRHVELPLQPTH
ncbi:GNAT family N-acetyltransferase [Tepidimonas sp.]|uniref:GNAT family N-acetyltransferase n=1 Tax=Tepidimonas sp. TaxID=2002775 RepID=UPI0028CCC820|nr:GNAT family N-acetyltransferase [Tepidimonas sp.]MDT7929137.1 GNAT family N-acetyltransferase [Tepidimonas sp.]